jgi:hypothetical protein
MNEQAVLDHLGKHLRVGCSSASSARCLRLDGPGWSVGGARGGVRRCHDRRRRTLRLSVSAGPEIARWLNSGLRRPERVLPHRATRAPPGSERAGVW